MIFDDQQQVHAYQKKTLVSLRVISSLVINLCRFIDLIKFFNSRQVCYNFLNRI